jgi:hypothetical protein
LGLEGLGGLEGFGLPKINFFGLFLRESGKGRGMQTQILKDCLSAAPRATWPNFLMALALAYLLLMIPIIALNDGAVSDLDPFLPIRDNQKSMSQLTVDLETRVESLRKETEKLG